MELMKDYSTKQTRMHEKVDIVGEVLAGIAVVGMVIVLVWLWATSL